MIRIDNSYSKRRNIVLISTMLIIVLIVLFFVIPLIAYADDSELGVSNAFELMSVHGVKKALGVDDALFDTVHEYSGNIGSVISGLATLWIIALMIFEVFRIFQTGEITMELWLKLFVKIAIGIFLITSTIAILNGLDVFGKALLNDIVDNADTIKVSADDTAISSSATFGKFGIAIMTAFIVAYVKIMSYALIIELGLRRVFAPLAVANIVTDGIRSSGMRFFKKYLAVYIKMAIIIVCTACAGELCKAVMIKDGYMETATSNITIGVICLIECIAVMCASITFIQKSAKLADEVLGA